MSAILGRCHATDAPLRIDDSVRQSGLYILGKPRVGKSWLLVSLLLHDAAAGHGIFFLDPHGDAVTDVCGRVAARELQARFILLDPAQSQASFGLNPLQCRDVNDLTERTRTFARAKGVFDKLWKRTFEDKPWLQLVLQNTIYAFIETQGMTIAEFPLFFRSAAFRSFICENIKHNRAVYEYWTQTFSSKSGFKQREILEAAESRAEIMLAHPYVRHVLGQPASTIDFLDVLERQKAVLVSLTASLPPEVKRIIGTVLVNELVSAIAERGRSSKRFCVYVDEFQDYAGFEDFAALLTEAPKRAISTTIAHHERRGQLADNPRILGATAAIQNRVFFELTEDDARDFAAGFAGTPPTEVRREQELVISQSAYFDLLRGHKNPLVRDFVDRHLRPLKERLEDIVGEAESERYVRTEWLDLVANLRLEGQIEGTHRAYADQNAVRKVLSGAGRALDRATLSTRESQSLVDEARGIRQSIRALSKFLTALMEGRTYPGHEAFAEFLIHKTRSISAVPEYCRSALELYIALTYGDVGACRQIPHALARACPLFAKELKAVEESARQAARQEREAELTRSWESYQDYRTRLVNEEAANQKAAAERVRSELTEWHVTLPSDLDIPGILGAFILLLAYPKIREALNPYLSFRFSGRFKTRLLSHHADLIATARTRIKSMRLHNKESEEYRRRFKQKHRSFVRRVLPWNEYDRCYFGPYVQTFVLDELEKFLNAHKEGALVAFALVREADRVGGFIHKIPTIEEAGIEYRPENEWRRLAAQAKRYCGYNILFLPEVEGREPLEIMLLLEEIGGVLRQGDYQKDLARFYWIGCGGSVYSWYNESEENRRSVSIGGLYTRSKFDVPFGSWALERRYYSLYFEKQNIELLGELREEIERDPARKHRLFALCRQNKLTMIYLERRACDIVLYGEKVADETFPHPAIKGVRPADVSDAVRWMSEILKKRKAVAAKNRWDAYFAKTEADLQKDRSEFDRGQLPARLIQLPAAVVERVLSENERVEAKEACLRYLYSSKSDGWDARSALSVLEDFADFCVLLSRPENHVMVRSGQYVDQEVALRTEADMAGEIVRSLTKLNRYEAYAKLLTPSGEWRGKIHTCPLEEVSGEVSSRREEELRLRSLACTRSRDLIEQEIAARQAAWMPGGAVSATAPVRPAASQSDEPPPAFE